MKIKSKFKIFFLIAAFFVLSGFHQTPCLAQDESKGVQSEEFTKKRPVAKSSRQSKSVSGKATGSTQNKANRARRYYRIVKRSETKQPTKTKTLDEKSTEEALVGLTVWKIRPATKNDAAKELIEEGSTGKKTEFSLERLESAAAIALGEKIRLSVESLSHSGYLYVVEREFYNDGTYSTPKLIYPTLLTENRNNPIAAGEMVFVPAPPRYFRVATKETEGRKQVAEVLTFVVSPKILISDSLLKTKAIDLTAELFSEWLSQWEVDYTLLEQIDGAGQSITLAEQSAVKDSAKDLIEESSGLSQDDPTPQSVLKGKIKKGQPILVNVLLKINTN